VAEVARRPWPAASTVKILAVVKLPFVPTAETRSLQDSDYSRLEQALQKHASDAVARAAAQLQTSATALTVTTEILVGQPVEVILAQAKQWHADLIVLGSRGLGGFKRFLLGSTSQAVVQQAPCSVLLVRPESPAASATEET